MTTTPFDILQAHFGPEGEGCRRRVPSTSKGRNARFFARATTVLDTENPMFTVLWEIRPDISGRGDWHPRSREQVALLLPDAVVRMYNCEIVVGYGNGVFYCWLKQPYVPEEIAEGTGKTWLDALCAAVMAAEGAK